VILSRREVRQLVMERLVALDCDEQAPLAVVTTAVTELAELALDLACEDACRELDTVHGAPLGPEGQRAQLWVVGMGKLGARELNVSSDIDLIYVYDQDGETQGDADGRGRHVQPGVLSRAVKRIYALIGDTTEHGFVFRVDLALRPNGNSGPAVVSLDALEEYFQVQGREWERFAWMKSRVVAPRASCSRPGAGPARRGAALRVPPLPRLQRVRRAARAAPADPRAAARRSAGRPERANDVKLSRGGIREIEFTVQLLQVVRGGQFPELRTRPTLEALQRLARAGLMPQETADALAEAYEFLRRVEHRIQYLDDQQTHVLPVADDDLRWIAQTMGYADCCPFLRAARHATANWWRRSSTSCSAARSPAVRQVQRQEGRRAADAVRPARRPAAALAPSASRLVRAAARAGAARGNPRAPAPAGAAHRTG
jgi:glutamate-ammonia-ligase adenylyltransferase